jgi:hypothetical protein
MLDEGLVGKYIGVGTFTGEITSEMLNDHSNYK